MYAGLINESEGQLSWGNAALAASRLSLYASVCMWLGGSGQTVGLVEWMYAMISQSVADASACKRETCGKLSSSAR